MAKTTFTSRFGAVIRKRRTSLGVSQEEFADQAGLHRTYISLVERGLRNPSLTVIERLAVALGTKASILIQEVEDSGKGR